MKDVDNASSLTKIFINRSKKAQITVKAGEGLTFGPKGGDNMYAADITRTSSNRIYIKSASAINYSNLDDVIIGWAKGSKSCYSLPRLISII